MNQKVTKYKLSRLDERGPRSFLWGPPKTAKSSWYPGWPGLTILDFENRAEDTLGLASAVGVDCEDARVILNPNIVQITKVLEEARKWDRDKTFVFDGITSWADYRIREIMSGGKDSTKLVANPTMQNWTQRKNDLVDILVGCQPLKCNVIVIAHEELVREYDDVTKFGEALPGGIVLRQPQVPGTGMGSEISRFFDLSFYTQRSGAINNPKFEIVTQPRKGLACGVNFPLFKPVEELESLIMEFGTGKDLQKRKVPAFTTYQLYLKRLASLREGVRIKRETETIETEKKEN